MKTPLLLSLLISPLLTAYEMHEWGTFTTVSGSDGKLLAGLHIEEEHLPPFVHSHVGMQSNRFMLPYNYSYMNQAPPSSVLQSSDQIAISLGENNTVTPLFAKGMLPNNLRNVTVKMETPVIYFYGDDTPNVHVHVGFNGGTISEWYPKRKDGDTPNAISLEGLKPTGQFTNFLNGEKIPVDFNKVIDFAKPYKGFIEWDVEILPKDQADIAHTFKPYENYTWIYPRVPDANMLKVEDEYEDYLFYRGLGNFDLPAEFSVDENETLTISNNSEEKISFALAFENIAGKFRYKNLYNISGHTEVSVTENDWITPKNQQVEVYQAMRAGLVAQGLTTDEANGMVRTWWKSYFNKPGLRVFWVVPNDELEKILPLTLTPEPEKAVRVMVGRADVLRPSFEQHMVDSLGTHAFSHFENDRFFLPYKQRLKQLITEPVFTQLTPQGLNLQSLQAKLIGKKVEETANIRFYNGAEIIIDKSDKSGSVKWPLSGKWEIVDELHLKIGEYTFELNQATGILTAKLPEGSEWVRLEIQLKRYLN
ncbi:hypothetical protein [Rubritalea sp.]|uniref:hypothetical protein n=1 Tax=Rubritalea sp. TaxID=2109375 RepID=UPI003EF7B1DC